MKFVDIAKEDTDEKHHDAESMFKVGRSSSEPSIMVPVTINDKQLNMELDTGASVSIISQEIWNSSFLNVKLTPSTMKLKTYSGEVLKVVGQAMVNVTYGGNVYELPLQIVEGNGPCLFGRNWLKKKHKTELDFY